MLSFPVLDLQTQDKPRKVVVFTSFTSPNKVKHQIQPRKVLVFTCWPNQVSWTTQTVQGYLLLEYIKKRNDSFGFCFFHFSRLAWKTQNHQFFLWGFWRSKTKNKQKQLSKTTKTLWTSNQNILLRVSICLVFGFTCCLCFLYLSLGSGLLVYCLVPSIHFVYILHFVYFHWLDGL